MKKLFLAALLIVACLPSSFSQVKVTAGVHTGFTKSSVKQQGGFFTKIRPDSTNTSGKSIIIPLNNTKVTSPAIGAYGNIIFNDRITFSVDLTFCGVGNLAVEAESNEKFVPDPLTGSRKKVVGFDQYKDHASSLQTSFIAHIQPIRTYRWGLRLGAGISLNKYFNGREIKSVKAQDGEHIINDRPVSFGNTKTDDYSGTDIALLANPSVFVNLDPDGAIRLIADAQWSFGTRDMFTEARKEFLRAQNLDVLGKQTWRQASFRLGVEFCLNCRR